MTRTRPIIIDAIVVDPPVLTPGNTATITVHARSLDGGPLFIEISASDGVVVPTDRRNVFLWHIPDGKPYH